MTNKYLEEALENILEICDGLSLGEIDEIMYAVEGVINAADQNGEEYFNFAEYLLTHRQGDRNA